MSASLPGTVCLLNVRSAGLSVALAPEPHRSRVFGLVPLLLPPSHAGQPMEQPLLNQKHAWPFFSVRLCSFCPGQQDHLERLLPAVDVIAEEQVVGLRRMAAELEEAQQVGESRRNYIGGKAKMRGALAKHQ